MRLDPFPSRSTGSRHGRWLVASLVLLFAAFLAPEARGANRYVSTKGVDASNNCLAAVAPCLTIAHAVAAAVGGDTISIGQGKFVEAQGVNVSIDLTIEGAGIFSTRVSAKSGFSVFSISHGADVAITALDIIGGQGFYGGGIQNNGTLTLSDARVWQNRAQSGGGIANYGTLSVSRTEIGRNVAELLGGGIANFDAGVVILDEVRVVVNATGQPAGGGGIFSQAAPWGGVFAVEATRSEISHNEGGGIVNVSPISLVNSTVSRNTQFGIATGDTHRTELIHVTVAENGAKGAPGFSQGGLIAGVDTSFDLSNTIVANNVGAQCYLPYLLAPVVGAIGSLVSDTSCNIFPGGGNLVGVDPKLAPLLYNKMSLTWTHALKTGSPAIDAGAPGACQPVDQRGVLRAVDGNGDGAINCDIGAFEYLPPKTTTEN